MKNPMWHHGTKNLKSKNTYRKKDAGIEKKNSRVFLLFRVLGAVVPHRIFEDSEMTVF